MPTLLSVGVTDIPINGYCEFIIAIEPDTSAEPGVQRRTIHANFYADTRLANGTRGRLSDDSRLFSSFEGVNAIQIGPFTFHYEGRLLP